MTDITVPVTIIVAFGSVLGFFIRKYFLRLELLEKAVETHNLRIAFTEWETSSVKEDIKEIKQGIAKLVDRDLHSGN